MEKAKKLKKKMDRDREIAELDLGNIITDTGSGGRGRRNVFSVYAAPKKVEKVKPATSWKSKYKAFADSESSEDEGSRMVRERGDSDHENCGKTRVASDSEDNAQT